MSPKVYDVQPGGHIPGPVLHRYLTDFAKKFGVFARTKFDTKVESLEPTEKGGWRLTTSNEGTTDTFETRKTIIATGLTSQANFPSYPGAETFEAPYFHCKDFRVHGDTVETSNNAVVVGGGKSAMDVAYAYAESGVHVDLVIRKKGKGPV